MIALFSLQVAFTAGWLVTRALRAAQLPARALLVAHRLLLAAALLSPLLPTVAAAPWTPPVQVYDGVTRVAPVGVTLSTPAQPAVVAAAQRAHLGPLLAFGLGVAFCGVLFRDLRALRAVAAAATPWRRVRGVGVRVVSGPGAAPFAARIPQPIIVLDRETFEDPTARRLALRHELQHHRQADPAFAWLWRGLRLAFGWNPGVGAWARLASEIEEMACDAAVVAHPRVSPRAYGRLLLATVPCAPGPAPALARSPLHQRLSMLAAPPPARPLRSTFLSLAGVAALLAASTSLSGLAADHRLSDAEWAAARVTGGSAGFVAPDHPLVRAELGAMRSSAFFRRALSRRPDWAPLVDRALADAGLPAFLAAIPVVESGYSNWGAPDGGEGQSAAPGTVAGRGLWMFIPSTARTYGLRVEGPVDERLDPARETAAAVALLTDLHARYGDWGLALSAYNQGSVAVDEAVEQGGTRDVMALTEAGRLNRYAASVYAAAMVLADPALLDG